MDNTLALIGSAQSGDEQAAESLFRLIQREHMPKRISRHYSRNVLVEPAAIESEFLLGCWLALPRVKMDVGNPLLYMLWKGDCKVATLFRTRVERGVMAMCHACDAWAPVLMRGGKSTCRRCGETERLQTLMLESPASTLASDRVAHDTVLERAGVAWSAATADQVWFTATQGIQIAEMRSRLGGRVLELFDIIVTEGINRDSSRNYLAEIAGRWGVTTAAVATYLRKLRASIGEYLRTG